MAAGLGGLHEVREEWSIDDLADALEYLSVKADAEAHAAEEQRRASGS